jgi:hypothetical protein
MISFSPRGRASARDTARHGVEFSIRAYPIDKGLLEHQIGYDDSRVFKHFSGNDSFVKITLKRVLKHNFGFDFDSGYQLL